MALCRSTFAWASALAPNSCNIATLMLTRTSKHSEHFQCSKYSQYSKDSQHSIWKNFKNLTCLIILDIVRISLFGVLCWLNVLLRTSIGRTLVYTQIEPKKKHTKSKGLVPSPNKELPASTAGLWWLSFPTSAVLGSRRGWKRPSEQTNKSKNKKRYTKPTGEQPNRKRKHNFTAFKMIRNQTKQGQAKN